MTTRNATLNSFVLDAWQGRTPEPLNILGAPTLIKLASADTNGAVLIFQHTIPPLAGPPLHRHSNEDEWFYVLDGQITVQVDGVRSTLRARDSAFAPRGTIHTIQNFGSIPAEILVVVTPGQLQDFFEGLSSLTEGAVAPDPARIEQLAARYGIEVLGPPLS
jgi:mannose-6-phosphate isomerase-like protein (cupin superfamily)